MNVRPQPGMLRQDIQPMPPVPMNPHFIATQQQPRQQQQTPSHMSLMPNAGNSPMALLGGAAQNTQNPIPMAPHRYQIHQQNAMQQGQSQQINPSAAAAAASHPSSLGHNLQGVGFSPSMMQQPPNGVQVRRTQSHPQGLNQAHIPNMIPPQQSVNGINMSMNPQAQLRQPSQQGLMHRMSSIPGSMSPDIIGRQSNPQNQLRPATQPQLMNSLSQPSGLHQPGLQPSMSQNAFQQSVPHPHHTPSITSSPRPGVHPQQHPATTMMMAPSGSSQPSGPRQMASGENSFVGISNPQFPTSMVSSSARIPNTTPSFSFGAPVTQGDTLDLAQSISDGLGSSTNPQMRPGFQPPTGQQFEQSHPHFSHQAHPSAPPPRPPSHPGSVHGNSIPPRSMQPPSQHSPHQSDPMASHVQQQPQRPQSQGPPGRPPSQAGPSHTPRSSQAQLPQPGLLSATRMPPQSQPQASPLQQRQSPSVQPPSIAPRPQQGPSSNPSSEPGPSQQQPHLRQPVMVPPLGFGQSVTRLLQFSGQLSSENSNKYQLSFWESLVEEYFTRKAIMKITLWKDNERVEAKPLEIGVPILPRFFLVTTQAGVRSMTLSLDGARERLCSQSHAVIECVSAVWTYKYSNGYTVTLRGPLTVHLVIYPIAATATQQYPFSLKFDHFQFDANVHEKYISLESISGQRTLEPPKTPRTRNNPTPSPNGVTSQQKAEEDRRWEEPRTLIANASIPAEPVNAFGIPQVTMRCLELAEGVSHMTDLISFANEKQLGPLEALAEFAKKVRDAHHLPLMLNSNGFQGIGSPAVTLHPGMSMSIPSHPGPSGSSLQNAAPSADTPQKQSKPHTSGPTAPALNQPPAPSQAGLTSTPTAAAPPKRKSDTSSPTTANAETNAKRPRKAQKRSERNG